MDIKHTELLDTTIAGLGYEMLLAQRDRSGVLTIVIDNEQGIGSNDCDKVSKHLSFYCPVEGIEYRTLDVSSPGPERPLSKPEHYKKYIGRRANLKLHQARDGQRTFIGSIIKADENSATLNVDGIEVEISYKELFSANLCRELPQQKANLRN